MHLLAVNLCFCSCWIKTENTDLLRLLNSLLCHFCHSPVWNERYVKRLKVKVQFISLFTNSGLKDNTELKSLCNRQDKQKTTTVVQILVRWYGSR